jgi:hypothetical protein
MRRLVLATALLAAPLAVHAQSFPAGWMVRADEPPKADLSKLSFVTMSPGWHITSGPIHAIFYQPGTTAAGIFTATLDASFFGPPGPYPEGYGIFVGGKDLAGPNQSYLYFVAANNGRYLLKKRTGATTATVIDWTVSPAIKTVPAGDKGNIKNVFKVQAGKDSVRFSINGVVVATRPRSELAVDGIVGFRVNHSLSVHVAALTVEKGK